MKQLAFFSLLILLISCQDFNVKKTTPEAILNEELNTFNWNEVDSYPSFTNCDNLQTKTEKKACFENTLTTHILSELEKEIIVVSKDVNDTIMLSFLISEKGKLTINNVEIDSVTIEEIPNLENLIRESIDTLPEIFPAIKRGQQVKTEFKLPIILQVN